jgi:hypothetical protein
MRLILVSVSIVVIGLSWAAASTLHAAEPPAEATGGLESFFREYI